MTSLLRTLIADDELHARAGIRRILDRRPDVAIVGEARDANAAVAAIQKHEPDLVLLDVQMPGGSGFDVIRRLPHQTLPLIVFITAHDEYATAAFDVYAIDYVLKPFKDERIHAALDRARRAIENREYRALGERLRALLGELDLERVAAVAAAPTAAGLSHFMVRAQDRVKLVRVEDVDWIEAASYYARLHVGGQSHLLRETLNALENRLNANLFLRVHRSAIVNVSRIAELKQAAGGRYGVVLIDGTVLPVARSRWHELRRRFSPG